MPLIQVKPIEDVFDAAEKAAIIGTQFTSGPSLAGHWTRT